MADYIVSDAELSSIANAIRTKGGTSAKLEFPTEFVAAINSLGGAGAISIIDELDDSGGTIRHINAVDISQDTVDSAHLLLGYTAHDSLGNALVGTYQGGGGGVTLQAKSVSFTPSESAISSSVTSDAGYDGLSTVSISIDAISSNYVGSNIARKSSSDLSVSGGTVTAPAGYYSSAASKAVGTGSVTIGTQSATINPTVSVTTSGEIRAVVSGSATITPTFAPGYVSSVNAGTIDVSGSSSSQLTTKSATTITPTESSQTAVASGVFTTGIVSVAGISSTYVGSGIARKSSSDLTKSGATVTAPAGYYASAATATISSGTVTAPSSISGTSASVSTGTNTLTLSKTVSVTPSVTTAGYISSGTAGNASVSLTASVTTKGAATYTPTTSNQTISSGTYLTGNQTISGDANLVAGNIKSGTTIFGVTGTYSGGGGATNFVTGTFTTSSSTSTNGTVTVPYTGSGYPVMLVVVVEGGMYNSSISTWYNSLTRYAVGQITIGKSVATSAPSYGTSGSDNYGSVELIYKNSTSNATSYSSTRSVSANSYSSSNANGTSTTCVRWKGNNKTISYRTGGGGSSSYGLLASTTYRYYAVYSS